MNQLPILAQLGDLFSNLNGYKLCYAASAQLKVERCGTSPLMTSSLKELLTIGLIICG